MWKEAVVAYFRVLSRNLLAGTKKNHENYSQNSWYTGRDFKHDPPENEAGVEHAW
jgi:hypothetical protein